jgi:hypothetical protein
MGAEDCHRTIGDDIQFVDENRTFGGKGTDDVLVVYDFLAHVHRRAKEPQSHLYNVNGAIDSSAKSSRLG